jgi:hypothetical protein
VRFADNIESERGNWKATAVDVFPFDPAYGDGVACGADFSADELAQVVDDYVVIADPRVFVHGDALDDFYQRDDVDFEMGFFEDFAGAGSFERFAEFDYAAGEAPLAGERRVSAFDEEQAVAIENDCTHADHGR